MVALGVVALTVCHPGLMVPGLMKATGKGSEESIETSSNENSKNGHRVIGSGGSNLMEMR